VIIRLNISRSLNPDPTAALLVDARNGAVTTVAMDPSWTAGMVTVAVMTAFVKVVALTTAGSAAATKKAIMNNNLYYKQIYLAI
jgi:hypothetical protein